MNYGISLDWDGESKRPDWMQEVEFVLCDCEKCYFCLNGHTNGIGHNEKKRKVTVQYKCGKRATTEDCTAIKVSLGMYEWEIFPNVLPEARCIIEW